MHVKKMLNYEIHSVDLIIRSFSNVAIDVVIQLYYLILIIYLALQ